MYMYLYINICFTFLRCSLQTINALAFIVSQDPPTWRGHLVGSLPPGIPRRIPKSTQIHRDPGQQPDNNQTRT